VATYTLKENETIFDVLHKHGLKVDDIRVKMPLDDQVRVPKGIWWVGPGDTVQWDRPAPQTGRNLLYQVDEPMPVIDVYMGFMDEEVNARLQKLIEAQKDKGEDARPVILIERGQVDPDEPILEWRLGNYEIKPKRIIQVSPQGEMIRQTRVSKWLHFGKSISKKRIMVSPRSKREARAQPKDKESATPEKILARAMAVFMEWDPASDLDWLMRGQGVKRYFDLMKMLQHRGHPKTKSKLPADATGAGPWLSVVRFDVGNDKKPPIIVIRTPEMGLQPSLMCPYLAFLFKVLSVVSSQLAIIHNPDALWEWPLRVSQFGAQGSTSADEKYTPGSTVTVVASLLVGVEIASDLTVTAVDRSSGKTIRATYKHSDDSTMDDPDRYVKGRERTTASEGSKRDVYEKIKSPESSLHAYAVISLCTPAGVYDFVREKIETYSDLHGLVKKYKLDLKADSPEIRNRHERWETGQDAALSAGEKIEAANDVAAEIFRNQADHLMWDLLELEKINVDSDGPFGQFESDIKLRDTLQSAISKIVKTYKNRFFYKSAENQGVVTLSVAYFGGEEDKAAADELGIIGVNMEDYHVLRVLRSAVAKGASVESDYPLILGWRVDRINCDPKKLPPNIEQNFMEYVENGDSRLSMFEYVRVIIWGLRGVLQADIENDEDLKRTVRWKFLDDKNYFPSIEEIRPYFWSFVTHEKQHLDETDRAAFWVPDPFCIEIATDFVNELAEIKATRRERTVDGVEKDAGGISGIKNALTDEMLKELKGHARAVLDAWKKEQTRDSFSDLMRSSETRTKAIDLMIFIRDNCGFVDDDYRFVDADHGPTDDLFNVWLRPGGKWGKDITEATLQEAARNSNFKSAAIDRAFYKSSNMMALQTMANYFLWDGGQYRIPQRGKMDDS
jgi:hypothetical protein